MDISQFNMRGIICQCEAVGDIMWCVCALDFFFADEDFDFLRNCNHAKH